MTVASIKSDLLSQGGDKQHAGTVSEVGGNHSELG